MMEAIIKDCNKAFGLNSVILRYFNVAGNEPSGAIGDLQSRPQNLIPAMIMSHLRLIDTKMKVFGEDYPTRDGTGVRDYIHVLDLIDAHIKALEFLETNKGSHVFNLGTGKGISVLEIIKAFEKVTGEKLIYEIVERRAGDVASITTDSSKAKKLLGWEAKLTVNEMIQSMWKWYESWNN
jgi:UDP-glucose 4-epimerase